MEATTEFAYLAWFQDGRLWMVVIASTVIVLKFVVPAVIEAAWRGLRDRQRPSCGLAASSKFTRAGEHASDETTSRAEPEAPQSSEATLPDRSIACSTLDRITHWEDRQIRSTGMSHDSPSSERDTVANQRDQQSLPGCPPQGPPSGRYLTDDEIVEVSSGDERGAFRLRIWRGTIGPAVVLVSQLAGGPSPSWFSSQLANLVLRAFLHFPAAGMLNFEDETIVSERRLFRLGFQRFGHAHRCCLTQPARQPCTWRFLEAIVGKPISRDQIESSTRTGALRTGGRHDAQQPGAQEPQKNADRRSEPQQTGRPDRDPVRHCVPRARSRVVVLSARPALALVDSSPFRRSHCGVPRCRSHEGTAGR